MSRKIYRNSGLSALEVLTIVFIVLKLTGVVAWSWWWVLSPTLIPIGVALIFAIVWLSIVIHEKITGRI